MFSLLRQCRGRNIATEMAHLVATPSQDGLIIKIIGEMRLQVEQLERQLDRLALQRPKRVVIDLSELTSVSSLGMGVLVSHRRNVVRNGGVVYLAAVQPLVRGALCHARLDQLFPMFPTVEEAQAA